MRWKAAFYEEFPEEEISIDTVGEMLDFISEQLEFENMQKVLKREYMENFEYN